MLRKIFIQKYSNFNNFAFFVNGHNTCLTEDVTLFEVYGKIVQYEQMFSFT